VIRFEIRCLATWAESTVGKNKFAKYTIAVLPRKWACNHNDKNTTGVRMNLALNHFHWLIPIAALLALGFAFLKAMHIQKQDAGSERMQKIGKAIHTGALSFLKSEYKILAIFVTCITIILALTYQGSTTSHPFVALAFAVGAACSALAGFLGMHVATQANTRTAQAARSGLSKALAIAFNGGAVMGLVVVGLGLLGLSLLFFYFEGFFHDTNRTLSVLSGFSLGASSIALFARVGGGIYTKAADVGADLVGKIEAGIPEDHPLNPATIADNVGDNVGDVAGMGADLFESYIGAIIGSMVIGLSFTGIPEIGFAGVMLPLWISAAGIVVSILGTLMVRVTETGDPQKALNRGGIGSAVILTFVVFVLCRELLPPVWNDSEQTYTAINIFYAVVVGLVAGLCIGFITEYYCGTGKKPVLSIVKQSVTGTATNIIAGLGVGMISTGLPTLVIAIAILLAHHFAGLYGIAMAAVGMLANTGIQLAVDAYGPISDNAGGIAEMSGLPKEVRARTDKLDAVGNTTAAIGKGFAIGSAALTALALFVAFQQTAKIKFISLSEPRVMVGLFLGGMLPFVFSAMAMSAVGRAAMNMIEEVRRQFREIIPLKKALALLKKYNGDESQMSTEEQQSFTEAFDSVEYGRCVSISTQAALREMVLPGLCAILVPVAVGFGLGKETLGGLLAGVTVSGVMLAIFQSNAGGAWDNAKKSFEGGIDINGTIYHKGSEPHRSAVIGDTVGDPFKDTSGPSLNILIKLISVVSLVIAPLIR